VGPKGTVTTFGIGQTSHAERVEFGSSGIPAKSVERERTPREATPHADRSALHGFRAGMKESPGTEEVPGERSAATVR